MWLQHAWVQGVSVGPLNGLSAVHRVLRLPDSQVLHLPDMVLV